MYVLDRAVKDAADPMRSVTDDDGPAITRRTQKRITRQLSDVAPVTFITERQSVVAGKDHCKLTDDRAILITLAPVPDSGDRLEIGVNGWYGCLGGTWLTYLVTADAEGWRVEGTTGAKSMS
ncbi:MAG: hypothetical protein ACRDTU_09475 [Micromonosporaceae bacterium]